MARNRRKGFKMNVNDKIYGHVINAMAFSINEQNWEKCKNKARIIATSILKRIDGAEQNPVKPLVSPQFRCKCGKMMKYWDGCAMGAYGVDYENCEGPQYKCECGNKVYFDVDK